MLRQSSLVQIINILNDGQVHNGIDIGLELNMTRSAVWKVIKKLEQYGVNIESQKKRGYRLLEPLILLDEMVIQNKIRQKKWYVSVEESVSSTNSEIKFLNREEPYRLLLAEYQSEGRGRLQRDWYSPFGKNIYLSLTYPFKKDVSEIAGLSLIVSLAVAQTLAKHDLPFPALVKWPNDIYIDGKKIGGNLLEIEAEANGICRAIIGIGLNVNMLENEDAQQNYSWTSLKKVTGISYDRNTLVANMINTLQLYLDRFNTHGMHDFTDEWKNVDYLFNKKIKVMNANHVVSGLAQGITPQGHLKIQTSSGDIRAFSAGDTTILRKQ